MIGSQKYCLVIPHFNHSREFAAFLPGLVSLNLPCIVVDDGSGINEVGQLTRMLASHSSFHILTHGHNRGKGAAIVTGIGFARTLGMTHIIQVDADGQHNYRDIPSFIEASQQQPNTIICGRPQFDSSAPKARLYGRKVTNFWVALETFSLDIKDGLCGFRIYPIEATEKIIDANYLGRRMDFDTEILVKAVWSKVRLQFIDTDVRYLGDGASHFHYLEDNIALIKLHTRLMLGMLRRLPILLARKFFR